MNLIDNNYKDFALKDITAERKRGTIEAKIDEVTLLGFSEEDAKAQVDDYLNYDKLSNKSTGVI